MLIFQVSVWISAASSRSWGAPTDDSRILSPILQALTACICLSWRAEQHQHQWHSRPGGGAGHSRRTRLPAEKNPPHFGAIHEDVCWPLNRDAPAFQNIATASHGKCQAHILFDEQDGHAFRL